MPKFSATGDSDMNILNLRFPVAVVLLAMSAVSGAAEIRHTAHLWFCENERQAHGLCRTSHSSCGWDCTSLDFKCAVDRRSVTLKSVAWHRSAVGDEGRYSSVLDVPLYGSGSITYCASNTSKYRNIMGTVLLGQSTVEDCLGYSAYRSTGGEEP